MLLILCLSCSCFRMFVWVQLFVRVSLRLETYANIQQSMSLSQTNSINSCLLSRSCVIKRFPITITVLQFFFHAFNNCSRKLIICNIEIRVLLLPEQSMWSVAYCSSKNHCRRFNISRLQIFAFYFTGISKFLINEHGSHRHLMEIS